jgi:hypothetical protein
MGVPRASAPSVSGPVTGGAVFNQRPGLPSSRQSGLNRRAGMGMKLSDMPSSSSENKSSLAGIFGSGFEKWSQIVYSSHPHNLFLKHVGLFITVVICKIHDFYLVGKQFYILKG